jgi:benzoylformate decarboxylase
MAMTEPTAAARVMTGGQALLEALLAEGVEYIFGNPGTTESPFMLALERYPQLPYILALQEASVMGMADGYARARGRPAFVNIHVAAGLANAMSGLYNASKGGTPLVVTAGQSDTRMLMGEPSLSGDLVRMARQYTKWSHEVLHAADIPAAVRRAFTVAQAPPAGPVFLSLPWNVLDDTLTVAPADLAAGRYYYAAPPDPAGLAAAVELLAAARRPVLLLGDRVAQSGGAAAAVRLAEALGAPVYAVAFSEVNFPTDHPQWLGVLSAAGPVRSALAEADVVLAAGANLFTQFLYSAEPQVPPAARLIHLDSAAAEVGKTYAPAVGLVCDVAAGLAALADGLAAATPPAAAARRAEWRQQTEAAAARRRAAFRAAAAQRWEATPIAPERLMLEVAAALPEGAIVVDEAISHSPALLQAVEPAGPGSYFRIRGGAIGWGLPAALGVKLARPDRPVVAVVGDGSSMYVVQALWSALHHRLPVTWVVCNNGGYRVLKVNLAAYYGEAIKHSRFIGMDLTEPGLDFSRIAAGFGVPAERVEAPAALGSALRRAIVSGGPALVDVVIDGAIPGIAPDPRQARPAAG